MNRASSPRVKRIMKTLHGQTGYGNERVTCLLTFLKHKDTEKSILGLAEKCEHISQKTFDDATRPIEDAEWILFMLLSLSCDWNTLGLLNL